MANEKINAFAVAIRSLKDPMSLALINSLLTRESIDIILNTTSFAANTIDAAANNIDLLNPDQQRKNSGLFVKNIPIIQLILAANSVEDWQENPLGLRARDLAMNIALPEMDGRIISRAIAFKQLIKHDSRSQMDIISHCLQPERAKFCLDLAKKWIALQHKPNKDKRIALILANYPTKDGRIGNGVGLDTPASTINILKAMQAAQFAVEDIPAMVML